MIRNRETPIKTMIELASTEEEADKILSDEFSNVNEKYAYLKGMFGFDIVGRSDGNDNRIETDYKAALSAIVNQKWRR